MANGRILGVTIDEIAFVKIIQIAAGGRDGDLVAGRNILRGDGHFATKQKMLKLCQRHGIDALRKRRHTEP